MTGWRPVAVSALSLACFIAGLGLGAPFIAAYLAIWACTVAAWPGAGFRAFDAMLPWAFPALMLVSASWSQAPAASVRGAAELMAITGAAIVAARAQSPRIFVSGLMCALLTVIAAGLLTGGHEIIYQTGESAQHGLFASKNFFAMLNCILMLASASVLANASAAWTLRAIAAAGIVTSAGLIVLAKSVGALFAVGLALPVFGLFVGLKALPPPLRPALTAAALILLAAIGLAALALVQEGDTLRAVLNSVGKDTDLTGRSYLWQRAAELIGARPFLGVGYQAFWVQGNVEAEGLWRHMHVDGRAGVHFHNLFYEAAVEAGYLGVATLFVTLAATLVQCLRWGFGEPDAVSGFFVALCVFFLARAYVEVDFIFPFSHGALFLPTAYVYAAAWRPRPSG